MYTLTDVQSINKYIISLKEYRWALMENQLKTSPYRWVVLFAVFYVFVAFAFAFQEIPPLMIPIMDEFKITNTEANLLMSIVVIPGIFLGIPVGASVDKYGVKLVGFASTVLIVIGGLTTAMANSFATILIGRLILGFGGVFVTTAMPALIPQWFQSKELGKAMGIYGINMPLATVIAFQAASALTLIHDWRYPLYVGTVVGIVAIAVFTSTVKEGPLKPKEHKQRLSSRQALRNIEIWKVGIVWLLFNAAALAFTTSAPSLFENYKGMDRTYAIFLASILMLAAIPFVPVYGWFSDRMGRRKPLMVIGSVLMALAFIAVAYAPDFALPVSIIALGVTAAMVPPTASALLPEILGPSSAGVSFGVMALCLNIGAALGPLLIGYLIDMTKLLVWSFVGMAVLSAAAAVVAFSLKAS
jgi:MFS family permease